MSIQFHRNAVRSGLKLLLLLACAWVLPAQAQTYTSGIYDNFASPSESPTPSAGVLTWISNNYPVAGSRQYDQFHANQFFATTFSGLNKTADICGAQLRITLQNGHYNDTIGLSFIGPNGTPLAQGWGETLTNLNAPVNQPATILLNLASLPPSGTNLLPTLNNLGFLDVMVQDDTAIDAMTLSITPCRFDVFMMDNSPDNGTEPGTNPVWMSPDIRVCKTAGCTGHQNPEYGQTNYVYVRLRNYGPNAVPPHKANGTLHLYYTASGGAAMWPGDWVYINSVSNINLNAWQTAEIPVAWANVPQPGHYCLLARWVASGDPMTFAETTNTLENTRKNNNIAWKNVDVVNLTPDRPVVQIPFRVRNIERSMAVLTNLEVRIPQDAPSFVERGQLFVSLDQKLWANWSGEGHGFEIVGEGRLRIVNPAGALLMNLKQDAGAADFVTVTFEAVASAEQEAFEVQVVQHSQTGQSRGAIVEVGGVGYQINIGPGETTR